MNKNEAHTVLLRVITSITAVCSELENPAYAGYISKSDSDLAELMGRWSLLLDDVQLAFKDVEDEDSVSNRDAAISRAVKHGRVEISSAELR